MSEDLFAYSGPSFIISKKIPNFPIFINKVSHFQIDFIYKRNPLDIGHAKTLRYYHYQLSSAYLFSIRYPWSLIFFQVSDDDLLLRTWRKLLLFFRYSALTIWTHIFSSCLKIFHHLLSKKLHLESSIFFILRHPSHFGANILSQSTL